VDVRFKVSASIVSLSSKAISASRSTSMAVSECCSSPSDADFSSKEVAGAFHFPFCCFLADAASFWTLTMDVWFAGSSFASDRFFAT